jgi:hypothetical protein
MKPSQSRPLMPKSGQRYIKFSAKKLFKTDISSLKDIPQIKIVYIAVSLAILNLIIVLIVQNNLPPEVPLFYGLAEGPEQLSSSLGLTIPGVVSLVIIAINLTLAILLRNKFLQQTLILTSFAVSIFSIITTIKIILLIGSF